MLDKRRLIKKILFGVAYGLTTYLAYGVIPYLLLSMIPNLQPLTETLAVSLLKWPLLVATIGLSVFREVVDQSIAKMIGSTAIKLLYIKVYFDVSAASTITVHIGGGTIDVNLASVFHLAMFYIAASIALDIMSVYNRFLRNLIEGKDVLSS